MAQTPDEQSSQISSKLNAFEANANFEDTMTETMTENNEGPSNRGDNNAINANNTCASEVSEMIESVKAHSMRNILASTKAIESQYMIIVSDLNKKLKNLKNEKNLEISKYKDLLAKENSKNSTSMTSIQKLNRELSANIALLKETKIELNCKSRDLDKNTACLKALEKSLSGMKEELMKNENENNELKKRFSCEEGKLKSVSAKCNSLEEVIEQLNEKNKNLRADYERKDKEFKGI